MNTIMTANQAAMVASWVDWVLGVDRAIWSEGQVLLGWRYPLPPRVWVVIVFAALGLAAWGYRPMDSRWRSKAPLTAIRTGLIVFLAVVLAGPMLVIKREDLEPDWLLMLVDRSDSMQIQDAYVQAGDRRKPASRQAALDDAIARHADLFGPEQLGRDRKLVWLGFDAQTYAIEPPYLEPKATTAGSNGQTTLLRTAIQQALQRATGRPISGIVLFTDGRSPQSTGADVIGQLGRQAVSVFAVPLGAGRPAIDLSLTRVDAPKKAFANDTVPVTVWADVYPADAQVDVDQVRVRLVDTHTGKTLDQKPLGDVGLAAPLRLAGRSDVVGPVRWKVQLEYGPSVRHQAVADTSRELVTDNNQRILDLELVDRPIRALYIEGYPRWEYRYLKNVLVREKSIHSSMMLTNADQDFAQEGDMVITRLPKTPEEWRMFDVVIIGDVSADYFSLQQHSQLRDHIGEGAAGLLWIGGAYHTPQSYDTTQLSDVLPMRRPGLTQPMDLSGPLIAAPTPLAESLSVITLGRHDRAADTYSSSHRGWPTDLPGLRWVQEIGALKPSVDVLATVSVAKQGSPNPLVVRMRFGAGQVLYVATDDTWRWRYGRGDLYFQQFWLQLVRMLGRQRVQDDPSRVRLSVSHARVQMNQAVVVQLRIADVMLLQRQLPSVSVSVIDPERSKDATPVESLEQIELLPDVQPDSQDALPATAPHHHRQYKAIWQPKHTGRLLLTVVEPALKDLNIVSPIEVLHPDDELRQPMPDHERLETLAELSGGHVVPLDRLDQLTRVVPNRARRTANDIHQSLWDTPVTLIVVVTLLTIEWIGRKLIRLA